MLAARCAVARNLLNSRLDYRRAATPPERGPEARAGAAGMPFGRFTRRRTHRGRRRRADRGAHGAMAARPALRPPDVTLPKRPRSRPYRVSWEITGPAGAEMPPGDAHRACFPRSWDAAVERILALTGFGWCGRHRRPRPASGAAIRGRSEILRSAFPQWRRRGVARRDVRRCQSRARGSARSSLK